jgi:hypothetical protein
MNKRASGFQEALSGGKKRKPLSVLLKGVFISQPVTIGAARQVFKAC